MEQSYYINNAGLIILSPYLPRYFKLLDLMEGDSFKDETARHRAVHLLQFLASGEMESPEHMLVFNKILCGIPVSDSLPGGISVSAEEEEVSTQMLTAIIQNWGKLGDTSIEGFRGSFLLRHGRFQELSDYWQLEVEPKAFDVLMDFLPWNISMVKLSWIEKSIQTKWRVGE